MGLQWRLKGKVTVNGGYIGFWLSKTDLNTVIMGFSYIVGEFTPGCTLKATTGGQNTNVRVTSYALYYQCMNLSIIVRLHDQGASIL